MAGAAGWRNKSRTTTLAHHHTPPPTPPPPPPTPAPPPHPTTRAPTCVRRGGDHEYHVARRAQTTRTICRDRFRRELHAARDPGARAVHHRRDLHPTGTPDGRRDRAADRDPGDRSLGKPAPQD